MPMNIINDQEFDRIEIFYGGALQHVMYFDFHMDLLMPFVKQFRDREFYESYVNGMLFDLSDGTAVELLGKSLNEHSNKK